MVVAAAGPQIRNLPTELPPHLSLPDSFTSPAVCLPGVLAISGPQWKTESGSNRRSIEQFCNSFDAENSINQFPLIVVVDDAKFCAAQLNNLLWVVFTRSNPAVDIFGIQSSIVDKHWGCRGSLVIDARIKSHHAPPLIEDPKVTAKIDALAARGGPLSSYL